MNIYLLCMLNWKKKGFVCAVGDTWHGLEVSPKKVQSPLSSDLQSSFWTFAFLLQYLPEEPCCLLGAASVNCETETCVAIIVNHLKESRGMFRHLNDTKPMSFVSQVLQLYLDVSSPRLDGLPFQSDFAATRPEAAPVLYDSGVLELNHKEWLSLDSIFLGLLPGFEQDENSDLLHCVLFFTLRLGSSLQAASQIRLWSAEVDCSFQLPSCNVPPTVTWRLLQTKMLCFAHGNKKPTNNYL